jgi:hypothetical protein
MNCSRTRCPTHSTVPHSLKHKEFARYQQQPKFVLLDVFLTPVTRRVSAQSRSSDFLTIVS